MGLSPPMCGIEGLKACSEPAQHQRNALTGHLHAGGFRSAGILCTRWDGYFPNEGLVRSMVLGCSIIPVEQSTVAPEAAGIGVG